MASANIATLTEANFAQEVLQSAQPVLVDFWAEWCGPCKMLAPVLDELATEYAGRIKFAKVNVDDSHQLAGQYRITNIPTLLLFKSGTVVAQMMGLSGKRVYREKLEEALA
jgi:thioredoxin 1